MVCLQFVDRARKVRLAEQQSQLLGLRLDDEIDSETFAEKATELRDKAAPLRLHLEAADRGRYEIIDIALKAFGSSQDLRAQWFKADYAAQRRILEITCLGFSLDGATLVPVARKPFDMLAEGLSWKDSRGDCRSFEPSGAAWDETLAPLLERPEPHVLRAAELAASLL